MVRGRSRADTSNRVGRSGSSRRRASAKGNAATSEAVGSAVSFQLHPDARDELREAVVFYDRAAERFVNAVETAIAAIILKPDRFREFEPGVQTRRVSQFPYSILYTFRAHDIMILAVKHDR